MSNDKTKKKESFKQTYKKGIYIKDKQMVGKWVLSDNSWLEIINEGQNTDETQFVTIKINNLNSNQF